MYMFNDLYAQKGCHTGVCLNKFESTLKNTLIYRECRQIKFYFLMCGENSDLSPKGRREGYSMKDEAGLDKVFSLV